MFAFFNYFLLDFLRPEFYHSEEEDFLEMCIEMIKVSDEFILLV